MQIRELGKRLNMADIFALLCCDCIFDSRKYRSGLSDAVSFKLGLLGCAQLLPCRDW